MIDLKGFQKRFLRAAAHQLKPVVLVGQKGLTGAVLASIEEALNRHELIKIKFIEIKDKAIKNDLLHQIVEQKCCAEVGTVGHVAILYRRQKDPRKRKIALPTRA